jgi:NDP-sugar pyrophosphorylase family protein
MIKTKTMMAIILAGGKGRRLEPFTITIPKPLLPLGDISILEIIIRQLAAVGLSHIKLTLGHMSHLFIATIGNGSRWGVNIEYCVEEEPLGTAGPLLLLKDLDDDFLVMNGDILTTIDYKELIDVHKNHDAWATIAVSRRKVKIDFGVVKLTENGLLNNYLEKPIIPYEVSMGINVLSRKCLDFIPAGKKFDLPELILAIKRAGKRLICYKTGAYWRDIGRFDDYQQASRDFMRNPQRFYIVKK